MNIVAMLLRNWFQQEGIFYRNPKSYGNNEVFYVHKDYSRMVYAYLDDPIIVVLTMSREPYTYPWAERNDIDVRNPNCFEALKKLLENKNETHEATPAN